MQVVSLKVLGSEAKRNKTKEMNYSSLNRSQCGFFFISALDPRMNFNKFETGKLKPHLRPLKKSALHAKFLAPCLLYPTPKILSTQVPHYFWDRYVYTSKIGNAVP